MKQLEILKSKIKKEIGKQRMSSSYYGGYKQALIDVENMILEMQGLPKKNDLFQLCDCPNCDKEIQVKKDVNGRCPNCNAKYEWDFDCDYDDAVYMPFFEKINAPALNMRNIKEDWSNSSGFYQQPKKD